MFHQRLAVSATVLAFGMVFLALMAGPDSGLATQTARKVTAAGSQFDSPVNGIWVGRWKADLEPGEGKSLMCETVQVSEDAWKATFNAVCDKDYAFTMEVPGRREGEGDNVIFEATVDLGEAFGGEYHWVGHVEGDEFRGVYTHPKYKGTFHMTRSLDGVIEPGVYCKVPTK